MLFSEDQLPLDGSSVWARIVPRLVGFPDVEACWLYSGTPSQVYPFVVVSGRAMKVHRISYALHVGPIPDGVFVCHRCDVPRCCNPAHLFLGSLRDNVADMVAKSRQARGERASAAVLTAEAVVFVRQSSERSDVLARRFGVCQATIDHARRGHTWSHVPGAVSRRRGAPLTADIVMAVRRSRESLTAQAARYGCSIASLSNARCGRTWSHLPGAVADRRRHVPLTAEAVALIRCSGDSLNSLARRFGVSVTAVRNVRIGRTWSARDGA